MFEIKLIFYGLSRMLQFSEFVFVCYSVWDVFNNFLLIDPTDRSKISGDQKRFFYRINLIPPFIFRKHSLIKKNLPRARPYQVFSHLIWFPQNARYGFRPKYWYGFLKTLNVFPYLFLLWNSKQHFKRASQKYLSDKQ